MSDHVHKDLVLAHMDLMLFASPWPYHRLVFSRLIFSSDLYDLFFSYLEFVD